MDRIICVVGPTASGKTALAVELARELGGEVVSCDSMQIYKRMDIGTAKPTPEETQGIPHHMIDVVEPWEEFSVSRYVELATPMVEDILGRGKPVVVAGGTGLYVDALIRGNSFAPTPSTGCRQKLEQEAGELGMEEMCRRLASIDPEALARSQGNSRRVLRALEVYQETGETITAHNLRTQALPDRFRATWIGLDFASRQTLYDRIDLRVERMMEAGLLEEIRGLLASGVPSDATAMQAIGYKEFVEVLEGKKTLEAAVAQVQQSSRRYAKRQRTWFRKNEKVRWICRENGQSDGEIFAVARRFTRDCDN